MVVYDVAVLGGGVAAMSTAINACASLKLRTAVIQKTSKDVSVGEILPPAASAEIKLLLNWEQFTTKCALRSPGARIYWGDENGFDVDYMFGAYGDGWNIDRTHFEASLRARAEASGADIKEVFKVQSILKAIDGNWKIQFQRRSGKSTSLQARTLVVAAGARRTFSDLIGPREKHDSLVAYYRHYSGASTSQNEDVRLWLESTEFGWWYSAKLPQNRLVVAFLTDAGLFKGHPETVFESCLTSAKLTKRRIDDAKVAKINETRLCVAGTSSSISNWSHGVLAIGDSAFSTDPLRGTGIIRAMRQARLGSAAVFEHLNGDRLALERYKNILSAEFADYQKYLAAQYSREKRWQESAFWKSRRI